LVDIIGSHYDFYYLICKFDNKLVNNLSLETKMHVTVSFRLSTCNFHFVNKSHVTGLFPVFCHRHQL